MPLTRVILANLSPDISLDTLQSFANAHPLAGFGVSLSEEKNSDFLENLLRLFEARGELDRLVIYVPETMVKDMTAETTAVNLPLRMHLTLPESWDASHLPEIVAFVNSHPELKLSLDTANSSLRQGLAEALSSTIEFVHYSVNPSEISGESCGYQGTITPHSLGDRLREIELAPAHPYWISLTSGLLENGGFSFSLAEEALRLAEGWKSHFEEVFLLRQLHRSVVEWQVSKNSVDLLGVGEVLSKLSK